MFKEHPVFIHVPIASALISSPIVDQHPVATPYNEPIEDVDPVTLDVDLVAPNLVMDIALRRSKGARKLAILDNYIVYLEEHEYDVGDISCPTTYKEAIVSPQSNFWIDAMEYEMISMPHNKM